ncbi:CRISPR-associated protein Cas5 [Lihuaxuella thermophila]|uniref:CRISPR-associated protein Cas5, subtype I-B/HMARI n=1 Tax=Lihuaxuella thermophila TaxID=1173111 RepID=A0A1H8D5U9_9BACL|nr:CRISPR-associated protein Cas5 [Lihuaxuella thermophila]SEN02711.1 CRISPR-associated protein Cas5, subtype I-B/HMARI [Lihuaxuella thermophila]
MRILTFDCHVPGWCSFRIPHSINAHLTYPAPPPTTVYGLIANAMGLWQDDYSLMPHMEVGIRILNPGSKVETFTRWMKWNPAKNSMTMTVVKQKLIQPAYRIYVSAEESLLNTIYEALNQPARLLYLGESDDLVELSQILIQDANTAQSKRIDSSVPFHLIPEQGMVKNVSVVRWPVRFEQNQRSYSVQYGMVYLGEQIKLSYPIPCLQLSHTEDYILLKGGAEHVAG